MSFGFSVGDFLAVGKLTLYLCRAYKGAPAEFDEIKRELSSFYIVTQDLEDQAGQETSLLNRRGAIRKEELDALLNNLMGTLGELQALHQKYGSMGGSFWKRVQLGDKDLNALRTKLMTHIALINSFMASLTMASVGRMESMMQKVLHVFLSTSRGPNGVQSLLDAQTSSGGGWERIELELRSEGIPVDYIRSHEDDIRTLMDEVVADQDLSVLDDDIRASDSVSQRAEDERSSSRRPRRPEDERSYSRKTGRTESERSYSRRPGRPTGEHSSSRRPRGPSSTEATLEAGSALKVTRKQMLSNASTAEIKAATTLLWNAGYDLKKLHTPPKPTRSLTTWSTKADKKNDIRTYNAGALAYAAARGNRLAVIILLNGRDITPQFTFENDKSVLVEAALSNCSDDVTLSMIELLVECGALRAFGTFGTSRDDGGSIALISAAHRGKKLVVRYLLAQGVSGNVRPYRGLSALHTAVKAGHAEVVQLLLKEGGANVNQTNIYYGTPLDMCDSLGGAKRTEIERILMDAGGKLHKRAVKRNT